MKVIKEKGKSVLLERVRENEHTFICAKNYTKYMGMDLYDESVEFSVKVRKNSSTKKEHELMTPPDAIERTMQIAIEYFDKYYEE